MSTHDTIAVRFYHIPPRFFLSLSLGIGLGGIIARAEKHSEVS